MGTAAHCQPSVLRLQMSPRYSTILMESGTVRGDHVMRDDPTVELAVVRETS